MSGWAWALVGLVVGVVGALLVVWVYLLKKWPRG